MSRDDSAGSNPVIITSGSGLEPSAHGLEGSFRVVRLLGRGTMASVYLAEQVSMARPVALKILSPSLAGDPAFVERFLREARASARLSHPNIVSAIDFGEFDSRFFLAMEFVDGMSLAALLARDGSIEENRVISIGLQVISALEHAAQHNVIHLDVKPANIMICKDGRVKLTDFGLAMILDTPGGAEASRKAVGTPYYMAPEQVEGGELDWRADQFSLGASLYEAVTGQKPFQGNSVSDILAKRFFERPKPAWRTGRKKASRAFSAILDKMLSRSPEGRYQSFSDMERDFLRVQQGRKPLIARMSSSQTMSAPSSGSWDSFDYGAVAARLEGMYWSKRWNWFTYSSILFLLMLGLYAALHRRELIGPQPRVARVNPINQASQLSSGLYGEVRHDWVGATQLFNRALEEPTPETLRQAIHSYRLLANNHRYRQTAYAAAATRRVANLEDALARLMRGEDAAVEIDVLDWH